MFLHSSATRVAPAVAAEPRKLWAAAASSSLSPCCAAEFNAVKRSVPRPVNADTIEVRIDDTVGCVEIPQTVESTFVDRWLFFDQGTRRLRGVVRAGEVFRPMIGLGPASQHGFQCLEVDRLGDVVIHPDGQATLPILGQRAGGHRDDRYPGPLDWRRRISSVAVKPSITGMWQSIRIGANSRTNPPRPGLRPR